MANFKFKVRDKDGFQKTGTIGAADVDKARAKIASQGFVVLELREAIPTETDEPEPPEQASPSPPASGQRRFPLTLVLALAVGVGFLGLTFTRGRGQMGKKGVAVKFQVTGNLTLQGSDDLKDIEVVADFPEIPHQERLRWSQLGHTRPGSYVLDLNFEVPTRPTRFTLSFNKPGFREARSGYRLVPQPGANFALEDLVLVPNVPAH